MSNNQKVIKVISKFGLLSYLQTLINSKVQKITLHTTFPITGAPNWSEKKEIVLVQDVKPLINIVAKKENLN